MAGGTAQLVKDNLGGWRGHAALYRMTPPLKDHEWSKDEAVEEYEYVIASAVTTLQFDGVGPETYLFPATAEGEVINYGELPGSMKGTLSHREALKNAGYTLSQSEPS